MLDSKANEIANFLIEKGYGSIYLPRDAYGDINILIDKPFAFFSHKHAAYLAGMGAYEEIWEQGVIDQCGGNLNLI